MSIDKEKLIEETMYEICAVLREHLYRKESEIASKLIAEYIIKNDWVKLPKDSVVLSRGEYEKLTNSDIGELVKENKELEEQCIKWMDMFRKKKEQLKQERKETAKKALDWIDTYYPCYSRADLVRGLAKQLGVEIEGE